MRRTRSRHAGRSAVSGQTTPNRNGLVVGLDTSPPAAWISDNYTLDCEQPLKSSQSGEDGGEDDGAAVGEGVTDAPMDVKRSVGLCQGSWTVPRVVDHAVVAAVMCWSMSAS